MDIQPFMSEDYDQMIALWERAGLPFEKDGRDSRKSIERQMFDDHIAIITLKEQDRLIGVIIATYDGRKGWINRLAVDPDFRGRRLAARLVQAAEEKLTQMGANVIGGLIDDNNFPSMAAVKYCGYEGWDHLVYFRKKLNKQ